MRIVTPVLLVALVVLSTGVMGTVGTETLTADSSPTEIAECTNITEPGNYVITQNILGDSELTCIQVTASDVVIDGQGYVIDVRSYSSGIISVGADDRRLSNVTVRNVEASGAAYDPAISYESVDDVTVANVTLSGNREGVLVVNSSDISVRESTMEGRGVEGTNIPSLSGVHVTNSSDTVIAANSLGGFGSVLEVDNGSTNTTIANNRIRRGENALDSGGVEIDGTVGTTVVNNTIGNQRAGVVVQSDASNTVIARNDISHTGNGVRVNTVGSSNTGDGNETTIVKNNTITESTTGVMVETQNGTLRIQNNELAGNGYGVHRCQLREETPPAITGTEDVEIRHNVIVNNSQYGILNERSVTLNATQNYWGAFSGPSSVNDSDAPFEDPVTGTLADGEGDAISEGPEEPGISNVHFDPWLNQSVTNVSIDEAS